MISAGCLVKFLKIDNISPYASGVFLVVSDPYETTAVVGRRVPDVDVVDILIKNILASVPVTSLEIISQ
tara:strand:- start:998 stop:1204 length:207 start_codon:yes stop_codon:yes gene_type:complete